MSSVKLEHLRDMSDCGLTDVAGVPFPKHLVIALNGLLPEIANIFHGDSYGFVLTSSCIIRGRHNCVDHLLHQIGFFLDQSLARCETTLGPRIVLVRIRQKMKAAFLEPGQVLRPAEHCGKAWVRKGFRFFFNDAANTELYTLSLHDALPI